MESRPRPPPAKSSAEKRPPAEGGEKRCSFCRETPRQIICLSCDHEACLDCFWAGAGAGAGGEVPKSFKCGICRRLTLLGREVRQLIASFPAVAATGRPPATVNYSFVEYDLSDSGLSSPPSASPERAAEELRCARHDAPVSLYDEERREPLCAACPRVGPRQKLVAWRQAKPAVAAGFKESLRELELRRRLIRGQVSEGALRRKAYEEAAASEFQKLDGALRKAAAAVERAREEFERAKLRLRPPSPEPAALTALEAQTKLLKQLKELKANNHLTDEAMLRFCFAHSAQIEELLEAPLAAQPLTERGQSGSALAAAARALTEKVAQELKSAAVVLESPQQPPTEYKGKFGFSLEKAARQASFVNRDRPLNRQSNSPQKQKSKNLALSQIVRNNASAFFKSSRKF